MRQLFLLVPFLQILFPFNHTYSNVASQEFCLVEQYGAFVYFGSAWVFCPSDSLNTNLFKCKLNEAFILDNIPESFGVNRLPDSEIGDTICIMLNDKFNDYQCYQKQYIVYFFGNLVYKIQALPKYSINIDCKYTIIDGYDEYKVGCIYLNNSVLEIKPIKLSDKIVYLKYLREKGYRIPNWASEVENK